MNRLPRANFNIYIFIIWCSFSYHLSHLWIVCGLFFSLFLRQGLAIQLKLASHLPSSCFSLLSRRITMLGHWSCFAIVVKKYFWLHRLSSFWTSLKNPSSLSSRSESKPRNVLTWGQTVKKLPPGPDANRPVWSSQFSQQAKGSEPKSGSSALLQSMTGFTAGEQASLSLMLASWTSFGLEIRRWDRSLSVRAKFVILYLLNNASHGTQRTQRSQNGPREPVLSFYLVGPWDWIQGRQVQQQVPLPSYPSCQPMFSLCLLCRGGLFVFIYDIVLLHGPG